MVKTEPTKKVKSLSSSSCKKFLFMLILILVFIAYVIIMVILFNMKSESDSTSCLYEGITYEQGVSFDAPDGCNVCSCINGEISCTSNKCRAGSGGVIVGGEENWEEVEFSIKTSTGSLMEYDLLFDAEVPSGTNIDESNNSLSVSNISPEVVLSGDLFQLKVYRIYEAESVEFSEALKLFNHEQFGQVYRIKTEGYDKYEYTTDITLTGECDSYGGMIESPCGSSVIRLDSQVFFLVDCEPEEDYIYICDKIVNSFDVEMK